MDLQQVHVIYVIKVNYWLRLQLNVVVAVDTLIRRFVLYVLLQDTIVRCITEFLLTRLHLFVCSAWYIENHGKY